MRILKSVLIGAICVAGVVTGICIVKSRSSAVRHRGGARTYGNRLDFEKA